AKTRHMRVGLTADHAPDLIPLLQQVLGEVGTVLPGDTGDERSLGQRNLPGRYGWSSGCLLDGGLKYEISDQCPVLTSPVHYKPNPLRCSPGGWARDQGRPRDRLGCEPL